ncbi:alkylmercury lyase family protein [Microbacterium sp. Au-Mic1]|uniref:organomercurial lyase n=1 Tax=Microbacterium sp. Au-Mic1 TaxID=2906457 RepID=UPI001E436CB1|nr:organomercurial lyase [Microbacterium sp. Au-Mic1]MCE4025000.1 alkylmercury lyase family protein [Microbacterium sp. Au-Mic1]
MTADATDAMTDEAVRLTIYRQLAATGRHESPAELAARLGSDEQSVRVAIRRLGEARHFGLRDGEIVLAHPFATESFGYSVMGARTLWWGGCAWDSFAIPHLVAEEPEVLVATACPHDAVPLAWTIRRDGPPEGTEVVHFQTPMHEVWDDVLRTCHHQQIFCSAECVRAWAAREEERIGEIFPIQQLWRLASEWYAGRLDEGYRRRDPQSAVAYFAGVGLTGPFWGS